MRTLHEAHINLISEGTQIEGKVVFDQISKVQGTLVGEVIAKEGSTLIIGEAAWVEGNIQADDLIVDGYIHGDITAKKKVIISRTGRVQGNITTPSLKLEFGSYFEGRCSMEQSVGDMLQ